MSRILNKKESRQLILDTLKPIDELVKTTYGPYGDSVLISNQYEQVYTKDGLSVISAVSSEDLIENNIIKDFVGLVKYINDINKDGSTSTSIITYSLIKHFNKDFSYPPFKVAEFVEKESKRIQAIIDENAESTKKEDIESMLSVVLNNDEKLMQLMPKNITGNFTYEVVRSNVYGEYSGVEYHGYKTNATSLIQSTSAEIRDSQSQNPNIGFKSLIVYVKEFSDYTALYRELKKVIPMIKDSNEWGKGKLPFTVIMKRVKGSKDDLISFAAGFYRDFGINLNIYSSLLPPKGIQEFNNSTLISHCTIDNITFTEDAIYIGDNTHYILSLPSLSDAEFKQKRDAVDDAFSIVGAKKYVAGGGYIYNKIIETLGKETRESDLEREVKKLIQQALLEPIKILSEKSGIAMDSLLSLYKSNKIYNFASNKEEEITETSVKELADSLKVMFEFSLKYLSNFITTGSIIQQ
nr:MAG TPA: 60 kDa chaperonin [Crassvirales sp.]